MIIDTHVHMFESLDAFPSSLWDYVYDMWEATEGKEGLERRKAEAMDGSVERLIKDMDEAGVDKSVVFSHDVGVLCGQEAKISPWKVNEYVAECQRKYPDRLIGFVSVDPVREYAIELLEKGVTEWGLQGLKFFSTEKGLTDERIQPFLQKVNELELPVVFHQGSDPLPYLIRTGNPVDLNALTLRYPKIKYIAAHVARGWDDLVTEIIHQSGAEFYADIAAKQTVAINSPWRFIMQMRYLMDRIPDKILMGTDWPWETAPPLPTHKGWFDLIRNLKVPEQVLQLGLGIRDFSQREKDLILGENAKRLLRIE